MYKLFKDTYLSKPSEKTNILLQTKGKFQKWLGNRSSKDLQILQSGIITSIMVTRTNAPVFETHIEVGRGLGGCTVQDLLKKKKKLLLATPPFSQDRAQSPSTCTGCRHLVGGGNRGVQERETRRKPLLQTHLPLGLLQPAQVLIGHVLPPLLVHLLSGEALI